MRSWPRHLGRLCALALMAGCAQAERTTYRYVLENFKNVQKVHSLFAQEGWRVNLVAFDEASDAEALFVLRELTKLEDLQGNQKRKMLHRGQAVQQSILVEGVLKKETVKMPYDGKLGGSPTRAFVLNSLQVRFPLTRILGYRNGNPDEAWLETHFSFRTLFPKGLEYNGKPVDLRKYERPDEAIKWERNPGPQ